MYVYFVLYKPHTHVSWHPPAPSRRTTPAHSPNTLALTLGLAPPPRPQAAERRLTQPGDRVVVLQCPRKTQKYTNVMAEAGVVKVRVCVL